MKLLSTLSTSLLTASLLIGCGESTSSSSDTKETVVPTTYETITNVSFSGQVERQTMLGLLKSELSAGHKKDGILDAAKLKTLYANPEGTKWTGDKTFGKNLKSKTEESSQASIEKLFDDASTALTAGADAKSGVAGFVPRKDGFILVDANGHEFVQTLEKGLMGSVFLNQALGEGGYLRRVPTDLNVEVTPDKGTDRQHHWDEAYGYFTTSKNLSVVTDEHKIHWTKYAIGQEEKYQALSKIDEAFRKGRANIIAGDVSLSEVTKAAIEVIAWEWEKLSAAQAVTYLGNVKTELSTSGTVNGNVLHALSEAWSFIDALKFSSTTKSNATVVAAIKAKIGVNFWEVTPEKLQAAIDQLKATYSL